MSTRFADTTKRRRNDVPPATSPIHDPVAAIPRDELERRAYERFLERGGANGGDVDDWLGAERELLASRSVEN